MVLELANVFYRILEEPKREMQMSGLLTVLGFTTLESTLWNLASYIAFIGIIVGVLYERWRNILLTVGGATLACYSEFFFKDIVFTALQALLTVSGVMQLARVKHRVSIATMLALTVVVLSLLLLGGALQSMNTVVGVGGLLGITFGIVLLPRRNAFVLMTLGGVLLIAYAWVVGAWVFFWLNIFFALANMKSFFTYQNQ